MAALPALQQMPLDLEEISRMEMIAHRALERSREIWREASRDIRLFPRPGAGLAASASLDTPPAPEAVAQDGMWQLKSLVLQVMDLNLASLEWNMCCKLVSLGQHLGLGLSLHAYACGCEAASAAAALKPSQAALGPPSIPRRR